VIVNLNKPELPLLRLWLICGKTYDALLSYVNKSRGGVLLEYNRCVEEALNNICAPMVDNLGMHFCYVKKYKDNKQFTLIANQDLLKELFRIGPESMHTIHAKHIQILSHEFKFALWTSCISFNDNRLTTPYSKALWDHGCKMGVSVNRETKDYEETWVFIPLKYTRDFDSFCIRNCGIFTNFINYFNTKAASIININTRKLTLLEYTTKIDYDSQDEKLSTEKERVKNFMDAIGMTVEAKGGRMVTMSKQEIKFLHLLSEGNSIKEIARSLKIAPKTSENHMYKIKVKTGYSLRSDLVKLYLDQGRYPYTSSRTTYSTCHNW